MEEFQMLDVLFDNTSCQDFLVEPLEEIIVKDPLTGAILMYIVLLERVSVEMDKSIDPKDLKDSPIALFLIYLLQGTEIIKVF